jgi:hypothetical protein
MSMSKKANVDIRKVIAELSRTSWAKRNNLILPVTHDIALCLSKDPQCYHRHDLQYHNQTFGHNQTFSHNQTFGTIRVVLMSTCEEFYLHLCADTGDWCGILDQRVYFRVRHYQIAKKLLPFNNLTSQTLEYIIPFKEHFFKQRKKR